MTKMITAFLVTFLDQNIQKNRTLAFCGTACAEISIGAQVTRKVRVPGTLAPVIECHCCGFTLDEIQPVKKGA